MQGAFRKGRGMECRGIYCAIDCSLQALFTYEGLAWWPRRAVGRGRQAGGEPELQRVSEL